MLETSFFSKQTNTHLRGIHRSQEVLQECRSQDLEIRQFPFFFKMSGIHPLGYVARMFQSEIEAGATHFEWSLYDIEPKELTCSQNKYFGGIAMRLALHVL